MGSQAKSRIFSCTTLGPTPKRIKIQEFFALDHQQQSKLNRLTLSQLSGGIAQMSVGNND